MNIPKVTGNREFFRAHASLYMRVLDGRCPICNSTIMNHDASAVGFPRSGLCSMCGKHYGNNLSRALYRYEREHWQAKGSEAADRRSAKQTLVRVEISQDGSQLPIAESPTEHRNLPFIIPGSRIYAPKIEPSYVIENREISRPPAPKYTPKQVSEIKVRKYLAERAAGIR